MSDEHLEVLDEAGEDAVLLVAEVIHRYIQQGGGSASVNDMRREKDLKAAGVNFMRVKKIAGAFVGIGLLAGDSGLRDMQSTPALDQVMATGREGRLDIIAALAQGEAPPAASSAPVSSPPPPPAPEPSPLPPAPELPRELSSAFNELEPPRELSSAFNEPEPPRELSSAFNEPEPPSQDDERGNATFIGSSPVSSDGEIRSAFENDDAPAWGGSAPQRPPTDEEIAQQFESLPMDDEGELDASPATQGSGWGAGASWGASDPAPQVESEPEASAPEVSPAPSSDEGGGFAAENVGFSLDSAPPPSGGGWGAGASWGASDPAPQVESEPEASEPEASPAPPSDEGSVGFAAENVGFSLDSAPPPSGRGWGAGASWGASDPAPQVESEPEASAPEASPAPSSDEGGVGFAAENVGFSLDSAPPPSGGGWGAGVSWGASDPAPQVESEPEASAPEASPAPPSDEGSVGFGGWAQSPSTPPPAAQQPAQPANPWGEGSAASWGDEGGQQAESEPPQNTGFGPNTNVEPSGSSWAQTDDGPRKNVWDADQTPPSGGGGWGSGGGNSGKFDASQSSSGGGGGWGSGGGNSGKFDASQPSSGGGGWDKPKKPKAGSGDVRGWGGSGGKKQPTVRGWGGASGEPDDTPDNTVSDSLVPDPYANLPGASGDAGDLSSFLGEDTGGYDDDDVPAGDGGSGGDMLTVAQLKRLAVALQDRLERLQQAGLHDDEGIGFRLQSILDEIQYREDD